MLPDVVVVADAGACEWRFGYVEDGGPSVILPAHVTADGRMDEAKLPDALQALESFEELEECALVLAEPPDESEAHRERAAAAAFTVQAVQAVCCYPGPLLAVYNAQFDTGVLVDVGFPATFIYIMYDGKSVLDGAVLHGLGGKHCGRTADASCDGLFDPSLLDDEHAAAKELCGLPEAIVRTVMLADVSLRQQLLGHVVLVGGTSKLAKCPERLEEGLKTTLVDKGATALMPRVFANPDRRLAQWLGGALLSQMTSAHGLFVSRDAFKADPRAVHAPPRTVVCRSLQAMEEHTAQTRATEAAAHAAEAKATREHVHKQLEAARKFWLEQSPVGSSEERRRMRHTQIWQVRPIYERSLTQQVLAAGCSQTKIAKKRRRPKSGALVEGDPDERDADDDDGAGAAGTGLKAAHGTTPKELMQAAAAASAASGSAAAAAALAIAARALRLLCESDDDELIKRQLHQRLAATWAVCDLNTPSVPAETVLRHHLRRQTRSGWLHWCAFGAAREAERQAARARQPAVLTAWVRIGSKWGSRRWLGHRARTILQQRRMDKASDWHSTGQLGDACAVWYRYADARRAAVGTMHKVCARFGCRRALCAFFHQARLRKLARLFKARSEWAALKTTLERALHQWSYMASMIHQAAHVRAKQKKSEREDGLLRWARASQAKAKAKADLAEAAGFARTGIAIQFWVAATRAAVDGRKRRRLEAITSRSRMLKIRRRFEFRHFVRAHLARKALKTHLAEVRRQLVPRQLSMRVLTMAPCSLPHRCAAKWRCSSCASIRSRPRCTRRPLPSR